MISPAIERHPYIAILAYTLIGLPAYLISGFYAVIGEAFDMWADSVGEIGDYLLSRNKND